MRALGATRGQIRTLFLGESAVAGLIGSAAGAALGLVFARTLTGVSANMLESMFGVAQNVQEVVADPGFLLFAMAMGTGTSVVAALIPSRNAARVEPIQALQKGRYQVLGAGENRMRRNVALLAAVLALVCLPLGGWRPAFFAGILLTLVACLLFTPFLSLELSRLLRRPLKWLRPVEGALAADSLIQAPRRTSATVAALMLSLALVVGQGGVARASLESIDEWMNNTLNPDMFVSTTENIASHGARFPAGMQQELENVPGIAEIQPERMPRLQFHGYPVLLLSTELAKMGRRVKRHMISGDEQTMNRLASQEKGVILSENLAALVKLKLGDMVELADAYRNAPPSRGRDHPRPEQSDGDHHPGTQPLRALFPGRYGGSFPRLSHAGRLAGRSPPPDCGAPGPAASYVRDAQPRHPRLRR